MISITELGKELKEKANSIPIKIGKCIDLNEEEAVQLYKIMNRILNNLSE